MNKVYGICSGEYSDWDLDYLFVSEEKRDKVLEKLNLDERNYYEAIDYDLDDDNFDISTSEDYVYVDCHYVMTKNNQEVFRFEIVTTNTIAKRKDELHSFYMECWGDVSIYYDKIIKYDNGDEEYLRNKYLKVCRDYYAKSKYMKEVDGMDKNKISETLFGIKRYNIL